MRRIRQRGQCTKKKVNKRNKTPFWEKGRFFMMQGTLNDTQIRDSKTKPS